MLTLIFMYMLMFVLLMVTVYCEKAKKYYLVTKTGTSFVFLSSALLTMSQHQKPLIWLLGFIGCFIGDVLLAMKEKGVPKYFVPGLLAFLFGHIFFILRMKQVHPFIGIELLFSLLAILLAHYLMKLEHMDVKQMHLPIYVYAFIVSLLFVKAIFIMIYVHQYQFTGIILATFMFLLSDFILLFIYFYQKKWKPLIFINLLFYYLAVMVLVFTLP